MNTLDPQISKKVLDLVDSISSLTQIEFLQLENSLRNKFNISDDALKFSNSGSETANSNSTSKEDKLYKLVLKGLGSVTRIEALKILSGALGLNLADAKKIITELPYTISEGVSKEQAESKIKTINDIQKGLEFSIE